MTSGTARFLTPLLICALLALGACSGGGGAPGGPNNGQAFSLVLYADPDTGRSPLTVSFFAVPSGGAEPYTYAWDFNGDNVVDSNAPSGFFTFTANAIAKLLVTDAAQKSVAITRTITITGPGAPAPGDAMQVRFTAEPGFGVVPFNVQFTSYIEGGTPPYEYAWDFENDGTFDNFTANPLFTFTKIGTKVADNQYLHFPVLRVRDNRGVETTNFDDLNGDSQPDFRIPINAVPPSGGMQVIATANPAIGQAPLNVEFSGSVTGGSGNYQFSWSFGDSQTSPFTSSSLASHTYLSAGTYLANVTVKDQTTGEEATSQNVTVNATVQQQLTLSINTDAVQGQVPFISNFSAIPVNGKEPITYTWDVFDDLTPADPLPTVQQPGVPPSLSAAAVVTPDQTQRKNPGIHFANLAGDRTPGASFSYVVRCVARDATGNTAVSNLIRVVANQNSTYPYYFAERPRVVGTSFFGGPTSHVQFQAIASQPAWSPRSNAAICSHPGGVSYIFGGEILDENGNFQGLVSRGNAHHMYIPETAGTGGPGGFGDISIGGNSVRGAAIPNLGGNFVRLNDSGAPAFPGQADSPPQGPPPGPIPTQRGLPPTIVGSAASVFIHEPVESNPAGAYQAAGYPSPDDPGGGFGLGPTGIGSPIIYVMGGRTGANAPVDLVQKYYVPNYGEDGMPPWDLQFAFQTTGNQGDIWSPFFQRPDTDQWPHPLANPQIQDRTPGGGANAELPVLPVPLYGLAAVSIETGVHAPSPSFPFGPFRYIFIFGGINDQGAVVKEMRWWNTAIGFDATGGDEEEPGVFSLMPEMPRERAYAKAILIPTSSPRAPAVALVGGFDKTGAPLNVIDIFQFNDPMNPNTGSWSTFGGTLPEAIVGLGGGIGDPQASGGQDWLLAFGGWTGTKFSESVYNARVGSAGNLVIREPLTVVPRRNMMSSQAGSQLLSPAPITFNRYYLFGGVDENGADSVVEVFGLP